MTVNEVDKLARQFNVVFPAWYKQSLIDLYEDDYQEEFVTEYEGLRETNSNIEKHGAWGFRWDPTFWAIGGDGRGGIYFIDTASADETVYYLDHDCPPHDIEDTDKLNTFTADQIHAEIKELNLELAIDEERLRKKVAERKWWQFWIPRKLPPWLDK